MNHKAIALPSLKKESKLPVILNQQELKELFAAPTLLKQRVVLSLIYSAGLRGQEVINLRISDIDFERKTIHIRQSKYKKDRIVPLADSMAVGLNNCGSVRYSYNSCGDRHCPKCQAAKQAIWIDELVRKTLPVKHFHIVFTVPHVLNGLCLFNNRLFYDLLFQAVWHTLRSFGYSHLGCETGAVAVLHTRGQNLSMHPHVHCIVPAAGYTLDGRWKNIGNDGKFLYPVQQLSAAFKARLLDSLKRALRKSNQLLLFNDAIQRAYLTPWVVHCEPSLANANHVVQYLGQYTHRVAITNQRILSIADGKITFIAKDYTDRGVKKVVKLDGAEFIRRFSQHILPVGFVKIRYFGIYNHTVKRSLQLVFTVEEKPVVPCLKETTLQRFETITGQKPCSCPVCKTGRMIRVRTLPRIRLPDMNMNL